MSTPLGEHKEQLESLCRRFGVRRLELFGSAAKGLERPGESDLDFLVEFDPCPPGGYADAYFGLLESLGGLYARPVDLVVASAIRNPFFLQSIERTRTILYAA
jgi:predicted nucleotidyltransferase